MSTTRGQGGQSLKLQQLEGRAQRLGGLPERRVSQAGSKTEPGIAGNTSYHPRKSSGLPGEPSRRQQISSQVQSTDESLLSPPCPLNPLVPIPRVPEPIRHL